MNYYVLAQCVLNLSWYRFVNNIPWNISHPCAQLLILLARMHTKSSFFLFSPNKYYISFWPDARAFLLNILSTQSVVDEILSQNEKEKHENHGTMLKKKVFCRVYCHFNPISQWLCFNMLFSLIIIIIDLFS